jgi:hypothetical protein
MASITTANKKIDLQGKTLCKQYLLLHGLDEQKALEVMADMANFEIAPTRYSLQKHFLNYYARYFPNLEQLHCPLAEARAAFYLNHVSFFSDPQSLDVLPPISSMPRITKASMKALPFLTLGARLRLFLKSFFKRSRHAS